MVCAGRFTFAWIISAQPNVSINTKAARLCAEDSRWEMYFRICPCNRRKRREEVPAEARGGRPCAVPALDAQWRSWPALGPRCCCWEGRGRPASISQRLRGCHRLRNPQERPGCTGIRPGLKPSQRMCWESPHRDVPGKAKSTRQNRECEGRRRSPRAIPEGFGRISP